MLGLAVERMGIESLYLGGWIHSAALLALAVAIPPLAAMALMRNIGLPNFAQVLGNRTERNLSPIALALGWLTAAATVLSVEIALGLVFDPRYRDFPYSPLTAAVVPVVLVALACPIAAGARAAERIAGLALVASALYIVINESLANWQAVWLCGLMLAFGLILLRPLRPAAPG